VNVKFIYVCRFCCVRCGKRHEFQYAMDRAL